MKLKRAPVRAPAPPLPGATPVPGSVFTGDFFSGGVLVSAAATCFALRSAASRSRFAFRVSPGGGFVGGFCLSSTTGQSAWVVFASKDTSGGSFKPRDRDARGDVLGSQKGEPGGNRASPESNVRSSGFISPTKGLCENRGGGGGDDDESRHARSEKAVTDPSA